MRRRKQMKKLLAFLLMLSLSLTEAVLEVTHHLK